MLNWVSRELSDELRKHHVYNISELACYAASELDDYGRGKFDCRHKGLVVLLARWMNESVQSDDLLPNVTFFHRLLQQCELPVAPMTKVDELRTAVVAIAEQLQSAAENRFLKTSEELQQLMRFCLLFSKMAGAEEHPQHRPHYLAA